jgi:hypothetical protein
LQLGIPSNVNIILQWVRTIHTYADGASQSFLNVTTADAADIKNRVQVQRRGCSWDYGFDLSTRAALWVCWLAEPALVSLPVQRLTLLRSTCDARTCCSCMQVMFRPRLVPPCSIRDTMSDPEPAIAVQLRGQNLVPFTFDKQVLLLETLISIWRCVNRFRPYLRNL